MYGFDNKTTREGEKHGGIVGGGFYWTVIIKGGKTCFGFWGTELGGGVGVWKGGWDYGPPSPLPPE